MRRASTTTNNQQSHLAQPHRESLSLVPDTPPFSFDSPNVYTINVIVFTLISNQPLLQWCGLASERTSKRQNFEIATSKSDAVNGAKETNNSDQQSRPGRALW
jgi:hypothetical protein